MTSEKKEHPTAVPRYELIQEIELYLRNLPENADRAWAVSYLVRALGTHGKLLSTIFGRVADQLAAKHSCPDEELVKMEVYHALRLFEELNKGLEEARSRALKAEAEASELRQKKTEPLIVNHSQRSEDYIEYT